ncbi:MAG: hypothetical protein V3S34_00735 [Hyphomicrobium sp.]
MKTEALIEHEPFRVFRYSLDGGDNWLTCVSTLRDDDVRQVQSALSARHAVVVREKMRATYGLAGCGACRGRPKDLKTLNGYYI